MVSDPSRYPTGLRGSAFRNGFEPPADLRDVVAEIVDPRQRRERFEPEDALEERRRPVADRAELVLTAALGYEPALGESRHDAVDVDAADARDLGARDRPEVRNDGECLECRL